MSLLSRTKGASFERGIAIALRSVWATAKRGIGQCRSAGEVPDVDGTPFWVECKHRKRVCIAKAFAQAERDRGEDDRPAVVITRENRGPILVTMGLAEWLDVVEGYGQGVPMDTPT